MPKQAIRYTWLAGFLLLALAACGSATATPEAPLDVSAALVLPTAESSPAVLPTESVPRPSATVPTPEMPTHPTETPPFPIVVASPTAELPFPALIRTLDFGIPAGNSYSPGSTAVHPGLGRLYVLTLDKGSYGRQHGQVTVLDLKSGEVLSVAKTGAADGTGPLVVDTLRNRVYAYNDRDNACAVLDAVSLEPVATIEGVLGFALDQASGRLYIAAPDGLRTLDVADYGVLQQNTVPISGRVDAMAVNPSRDRIYVAHYEEGGWVLDQYAAGTLRKVASTACPSGCRAVLPDPVRARVYLAVGDYTDSLWAIDDRGKRIERLPLGESGSYGALALDAAGDRLFAARELWPDPHIAVIDLETGEQVGQIALDSNAYGLAWDAEQHRLWFGMGGQIAVADLAAGQILATYPLAIDLDPPAKLVVGSGRLYLTDSAKILHILDTSTYQELAALPASGELVPEPALDRLYATSEESVTVVDTAVLTVTGILTPGGSVGWDPKRNRLYVGRVGGYGSKVGGGSEVYDALTLDRLGEMPIGGKVVYNPLRDELLVVALTVYRVDPETLDLLGDLLPKISAGERACSGCTGMPYAYDAQVVADLNRLVVKIDWHGKGGGGCGPAQSIFDATTLEPVPLAAVQPSQSTCNGRRALPEAIRDRVYKGLWCGWAGGSYRNLLVYDLQGELLTWRDGVDAGLINPNTCQSYLDWGDRVRVLDLPTLTSVGDLPKGVYTLDAAAGRLYATSGSVLWVYAEQGGRPEPPAPPSEAGPLPAGRVVWLGASPAFGQDRTLFATLSGPTRSRAYRSTDGGATWVRLHGGLPEGSTLSLAVSPGFAADRTLFAGGQWSTWAGEGVWRSADGGDTWQPMWEGLLHLAVQSIALSPEYAGDGTLLAYSEFHDLFNPAESLSHTSVSRSTDRGLHWTLVATGTVPALEELLPTDPRSGGLRFCAGTSPGWVDRWTAEVGAWQPVFRVPEVGNSVVAVLPSPAVGSGGTVYVLAQAGLFRSTDRGESWSRCPEGRLDGRDYTNQPTTAAWVGDRLAVGTANGEVLFIDPAALECGPLEVVSPWPAVLAGSRIAEIAAAPKGSPGGGEGGRVWLIDAWNDRLYLYAGGAIRARHTGADRLPGKAHAMAVTPGGVLWVGSYYEPPGVASFDGRTWTPQPLPSPEALGVAGLAAGPDGRVWAIANPRAASTENGTDSVPVAEAPRVYRWTGLEWELLADPQGRLGENVHAIAIAPDGSPWVATRRGLAHYARGGWTAYDVGECVAVAIGPGGEVYGLVPLDLDAVIWRFADGVWTTLPSAGPEFVGASALYAARDGSLWAGTARGAFRCDGQAWRQFPADSGLPGWDVEAIAEDADGELWFGTDNGAAHIDARKLSLSPISWPAGVPVPFPTAGVTPSPTPAPTPTPTPVPTAYPVAERFAAAYADAWIAIRLGLPREAGATQAAFQAFEHGVMIWRADTNSIYALLDGGSMHYYSDTWDESQPLDDPARVPPDGLYQPVRGFGKLWRSEVALAKLGWALAPEQGYEMLFQRFEGGTMLLGPQGEVYALLPNWTWERR